MECTCVWQYEGLAYEHEVSCDLYEPPLTQAEIRDVRRLLAGRW